MNKITIISGRKQSGKTTKLLEKISNLQSFGKKVCGIVSVGVDKNGERLGF